MTRALSSTFMVALLGLLLLAAVPQGGLPDERAHRRWTPKELQEGELIRRRAEWFYASRRPGAEGRLAEKREMAVERARAMQVQTPEGAEATQWVPRGPSSATFGGWRFGKVTGRVAAMAKDFTNGVLYVGSASGGLWKTANDGASWTPLFDSAGTMTVGAIALDRGNPPVIWVGTGENSASCEEYFGIGLLRSRDGGLTWEKRNGAGSSSLSALSTFASILIDPRSSSRLVVGGARKDCARGTGFAGGIYTTDNAGASWTPRLAGSVTRIARDPQNAALLWAGVDNKGVYKSVDGGNTWLLQTGLPSGALGRVEVDVAPSNGGYVYVLFEGVRGGSPQFWRTTDGGASWSMKSSGTSACDGQCWYNMVLRVHPKNPATLYRGTIQLFKSVDGGATWTNLTNDWGPAQKVHQDTHALLIDPAHPDTVYVGSDGGVWKTTNGGRSFANLNANLCFTQFYDIGIHPIDDAIIVGGAQDNSSLVRTGSDTWELLEVTGDGFVSAISPGDPDWVYTASYPWDEGNGALPSILRSTRGFLGVFEWITDARSGISAGDRIGWVTPYALDETTPSTLFVGTHRVYRSRDGGDRWTAVGPADMTRGGYAVVNTIAVARRNGNYVYAGTTDAKVWRSTDGGGVWNEISGRLPPSRWVNDIATDPSDAGRAFCAVSGFGTAHLYELSGSGWVARGRGLPDVPANTVLHLSAKTVIVGTDVGVFRSTDRGVSFKPFNTGLPAGLVVTDLEYNRTTRTLTAGTYGRGAWQIGPLEP